MSVATILIQKENMGGDLGLFSPALMPGGEVVFHGGGGGYMVRFAGASPLEGTLDFEILDGGVRRYVNVGAELGVYAFTIEPRTGGRPVHLQLTIAAEGVSRLGLRVEEGDPWSVVTEQRVSLGGSDRLAVDFWKSLVNGEAPLTLRDSRTTAPIQHEMLPGENRWHHHWSPVAPGDQVTVTLGNPFVESGGTKVADIILEP